MLSLFFDSKNKKLVKKWKKEHQKINILGKKVLAEHLKGKNSEARKILKKFLESVINHLVNEDKEFNKMLENKNIDEVTAQLIVDFKRTFKDTKTMLTESLTKYVEDDVPLDDEFFKTFSKIMDMLDNRIEYEESRIYFRLSLS